MKNCMTTLKWWAVSIAICLFFSSNVFALVYVSQVDDDIVTVIDPVTHGIVTTIPVGSEPRNLASNPSGTRLYVPNRFDNTVSVIDTSTNTVIATVTHASFDEPYAVAVTPDGSEAWVVNKRGGGSTDGSVTIINTATNTVSSTIDHVDFSSCEAIAMNPVTARAYVVNKSGGTVTIVNTDTQTVITTVSVGYEPRYAVVTPNGSFVYVSVMDSDVVAAKINTANNGVTTIGLAGSGGYRRNMAITPTGSKVYVATQDDNLAVIDTSDDSTSFIIFSSEMDYSYGVALVPGTTIGYVTDDDWNGGSDEGGVYAFDTTTDTQITGANLPIVTASYARAIVAVSDQPPPSGIPTLNQWGIMVLVFLTTLGGVLFLRRM